MNMLFDWDELKAVDNERKHRVTFQEAISVFIDPLSELFDDAAHSEEEDRLVLIGHSDLGRLLLVSFTERPYVTRIISARQVTLRERKGYETHLSGL